MKRTVIAVPILLVIALCVGCDKGTDTVLPDGTKIVHQRTLKDGTRVTKLIQFPDGEKKFDDTQFPDGSEKVARVEYPNGEKDYDVTWPGDGSRTIGRATYPDGAEKRNLVIPRVLSIYGLQIGQTQAEANSALKNHGFAELANCEQKFGTNTCSSKGSDSEVQVDFRDDGRMTKAKATGLNDDPFHKLQQEITGSLGKETKHTAPEGLMPESWAWDTNESAPCPLFTENRCPAVELEMVWYKFSGEVELTGNALLSEGQEVFDKNAPHPKVAHAISFAGLHGGQTLDQVRTALRAHKYPPLNCKPDKSELDCTTKTASGEIELRFYHQKLESFNSSAPDQLYDQQYNALCQDLGEPTLYRGKVGRKKGDGAFDWESAQTTQAMMGDNQVPVESLIFSGEDGQSKITYTYFPLIKEQVTEEAEIATIRARLGGHDLLFMPSKYYITGDGYYMVYGSALVKDKAKTVPMLMACQVGGAGCHALQMKDGFLGRIVQSHGMQFFQLETSNQDALTFFKLNSSMANQIPAWMWHYE